jgi:hypothetical protein
LPGKRDFEAQRPSGFPKARAAGKSPQTSDCLVAEAVEIEPVSTTEFAENREKYREMGI